MGLEPRSKATGVDGTGDTCKYMRFDDAADLAARRGELEAVVRAWCDWNS